MRPIAAATLLTLANCAPGPPYAVTEPGPAFDPITFFEGASFGLGTIDQLFKEERRLRVGSVGHRDADGTLTVEQRIDVKGEHSKTRTWRLRRIGPGRYRGTLTDASGPIEARAIGRAIRIRYPMKGGLQVEQWLVREENGALDNRLSVRKWGIEVASVRERIVSCQLQPTSCAGSPAR